MLASVINLDQNTWTRSGQTIDVQMDEGICLALCHEWCQANALRRFNDLELFFSGRMPSMHRLFSFQRGFNLVSDSLTRGVNYANYYQTDEGLTTNMVTRDARRNGIRVSIPLQTAAGGVVANLINNNYKGDTYLIGFWGVDQGENWGHVTAVSWPPNKANAYYFDPNEGLFKESASNFLGTDTLTLIDNTYDVNTINNFTVYQYTKI